MARTGLDEVVLLTGFPSFQSRELLREILRVGKRTLVHALVRPKHQVEARAALDALAGDARQRVNLIEGDAASMDLGLSGVEFKALAREVDRIHHVASVSYFGVDRDTAEHVNVGGAREVLELAYACRDLKCLVLHSSVAVSGDRTGVVLEDELKKGQSFRNVVEETRARAEKLVREAMPRVPALVLRPGIIVGDSKTGEVDRFDGPYLLILLIVTSPPDFALPILGHGTAPLNLVPIDYVVRAAVAIGRDPRAPGRTFHLVDPSPPTAREVFELVARAGGRRTPRGSIPANLARAVLRAPGLERLAQSPRAFLEAMVTQVTYDATNTEQILEGTGIQCPPFESYVEHLVEYVQMRMRARREQKIEAAAAVEDPLV